MSPELQRNRPNILTARNMAALGASMLSLCAADAHANTARPLTFTPAEIIAMGNTPTEEESAIIDRSFTIADQYARHVRPDVANSPNCRVNNDPTTNTLTYSMLSNNEMRRLSDDAHEPLGPNEVVAAYAHVNLCHISFNRDTLAELPKEDQCVIAVHEKWHIGGAEHDDPQISTDGKYSPMHYSALETQPVANIVPGCSDTFDLTKKRYTDRAILSKNFTESNETIGVCRKAAKKPEFYCTAYSNKHPKTPAKKRHYKVEIYNNHLTAEGIANTATQRIKQKTFTQLWKKAKPISKASYSGTKNNS